MRLWIISIDLDGVLCKACPPEKYQQAEPIRENINKINILHELGHRIIVYTARGWFQYDMTKNWLDKSGVKYSQLVMGKLYCHAFIDDLSTDLDSLLKKLQIEVSNK